MAEARDWRAAHHESEALAAKAQVELESGMTKAAREHFREAALLEMEALKGLTTDTPKTLGALALNAVAYWTKAGDLNKRNEVLRQYMDEPALEDGVRGQLSSICTLRTSAAPSSPILRSPRSSESILEEDGFPQLMLAYTFAALMALAGLTVTNLMHGSCGGTTLCEMSPELAGYICWAVGVGVVLFVHIRHFFRRSS